MADNRKLAAGILNLPASARQELAQRAQDMEREGVVGMLRKAGKQMYDNPIVNTAIGFTPVLGDAQAAGETMSALNRGAPWQETAGYAVGMLPFIPMVGKTVWHGSPHTFDKFDLSKIGTGEGAQAYGHGLYLAESRPVAEEYQRNLAAKGMSIDNVPIESTLENYNIQQLVGEHGQNLQTLKAKLTDYAIQNAKNPYADTNSATKIIEAIDRGAFDPKGGGSLYKVDLPDEQIAKMLDWDKPLSQQAPEVQQAIAPFVEDIVKNSLHGEDYLLNGQWTRTRDIPANNLWGNLANQYGPEKASQTLYEAGIPGIQYLDQASRGAGEGTRNYVVFSDEIPQILERNNQPIGMFK